MDTTGLRHILSLGIVAVLICFSMACAAEAPKKPIAASTPAPLPPEAVRVDKPVNVSFSTYSTDWPVGWQWIDPDERDNPTPKDVNKGVLRVKIPTGKDLFDNNRSAPRYVKPITGDFQIETRVYFSPKENYQGAGLLVYVDEKRYLRFERAYGGVGGGAEGIRLDVRSGDDYKAITTPDDIPTEAVDVELRLVRAGKLITAYWRDNEESPWREAGEYVSDFPETVLAGLVAANTAREVTAEFLYIRLLPANTGP